MTSPYDGILGIIKEFNEHKYEGRTEMTTKTVPVEPGSLAEALATVKDALISEYPREDISLIAVNKLVVYVERELAAAPAIEREAPSAQGGPVAWRAAIAKIRNGIGSAGGVGMGGAWNSEIEHNIGDPLLDAVEDALAEICATHQEHANTESIAAVVTESDYDHTGAVEWTLRPLPVGTKLYTRAMIAAAPAIEREGLSEERIIELAKKSEIRWLRSNRVPVIALSRTIEREVLAQAPSAQGEPVAKIEFDLSGFGGRSARLNKAGMNLPDGTQLYAHAPDSAAEIAPIPADIAAMIERTDWTPAEALQFYSDQNNFDIVAGHARIIDNGAVASNALKHLSLERLELKGDAELAELRAETARLTKELEFLRPMKAPFLEQNATIAQQAETIDTFCKVLKCENLLDYQQQAEQLIERQATIDGFVSIVAVKTERIKELESSVNDWKQNHDAMVDRCNSEMDKLTAANASISAAESVIERCSAICDNLECHASNLILAEIELWKGESNGNV